MVVVALLDRFHAGRTTIAAAGGMVATARLVHGSCFMKSPRSCRINDGFRWRATYDGLHHFPKLCLDGILVRTANKSVRLLEEGDSQLRLTPPSSMTGGLIRPSGHLEAHLFLDCYGSVRLALVGRQGRECHVHCSRHVSDVGSMHPKLYELGPGDQAVRPVAVGLVGCRTQGKSPSPEVPVEVVEARTRCNLEVVAVVEGSGCRQVRAQSLAQERPGTVVRSRDTHPVGD